MTSATPDDTRALIHHVCDELGLSRFEAKTIERWIQQEPASWPTCCLGGCDPCNDVLAAAARRVLEALKSAQPKGGM